LTIGPFDCAAGLRVIYESKAKLRPYHAPVFSEILAIKLLPITNYEFFGYSKYVDDLLPEEFSYGG
jgi:hypothetical protein